MSGFKSDKDRQEMLEALEANMNEEIAATLQYICHRISAKGREELLSESFKTAALDEMAHILYFSDLIVKYGGKPRFELWQTDQSDDIHTMLRADIELEKRARHRYQRQMERFKAYPEFIAVIEGVLDDEGDHEEKFSEYLETLSKKESP
jgi:bacterioferritin (cytochrome b1)